MDSSNDSYVDYLEWESLKLPLSFSSIESKKSYYNIPNNSVIEIFRDNEYKLKGKITGITSAYNNLEYQIDKTNNVDTFLIGDTVEGLDEEGLYQYQIEDFIIGNATFRPYSLPPNAKHSFQAEFSFSKLIENQINNKNEPHVVLEFYLTSNTNMFCPHNTGRNKEVKYTKSRRIVELREKPEKILKSFLGTGRDHMHIKTTDFDFIIQKVNKKFLPEWANGIQIEYRKDFKLIPSIKLRESVSEIVSFILGTHALKIGETLLDKNEKILKKIAQNPWGDNVISKCNTGAYPPIKIDSHSNLFLVENCLISVVPIYLKIRDSLSLKDILWKYWISKELAIGTNLPILSSALESLADNYINSKKLLTHYDKSEKELYNKLVEEEINTLDWKLKDYDFKDRIINKLKNPFQIGMNEKLSLFFKVLEINIAKKSIENQALLARNAMTHSSVSNDEESIKKYIQLTHAYMSLFHRIILKILDYNGNYIDYTIFEHPEKNIDENLGLKEAE